MGYGSDIARDCQMKVVEVTVVAKGNGTGNMTVQEGGIEVSAVTREALGKYRFKFKSKRLYLIGLTSVGFKATTPADLKGYTAVAEAIVTTGDPFYVEVTVYDSTFTAADLSATAQWGVFTFKFRETDRSS